MIPAIVYGAKSSEDRKGSIATQIETCRAAAEREGRTIVGEFSDNAKSAYKGNRGDGLTKAKAAAIHAAQEHDEAELWCVHPDRLARGDGLTADHLAEVFFALRRRGVRLRAAEGDSDLEDAIRVTLLGERNHEDSRRKSDAVRSGKQRQWERGERLGGPVPDGYLRTTTRDPRTDAVVRVEYRPCPERAPIIARVFELADAGLAPANIARRLNAEGYRTRGRQGQQPQAWTRRRIEDTLSNVFYCGKVARKRNTPDEEVKDGDHPPLIDPAQFARIRAMVAPRDKAKGSDRKPGRPYSRHALAGLATCRRCGSRMYAVVSPYKRKDGTQRRTYMCSHVKNSTGLCDAPPVDAEKVDAAIVDHLSGFFVDLPGWCDRIMSGHGEERAHAEKQIERETAAVVKAETEIEKLHERLTDAVIAEDDAMARVLPETIERRQKALQQAHKRLETAQSALEAAAAPAPVDAMLDVFNSLAAAVRGRIGGAATLMEVNAELREIFDRFDLDTTGTGIVCQPVLSDDPTRFMIWDDDDTVARLFTAGQDPDPPSIKTFIPSDDETEAQPVNSHE